MAILGKGLPRTKSGVEPGLVPFKPLAACVGINRSTLHDMRTRRVSEIVRTKLSWAINNIEAGRLLFRQDRSTQVWTWEFAGRPFVRRLIVWTASAPNFDSLRPSPRVTPMDPDRRVDR